MALTIAAVPPRQLQFQSQGGSIPRVGAARRSRSFASSELRQMPSQGLIITNGGSSGSRAAYPRKSYGSSVQVVPLAATGSAATISHRASSAAATLLLSSSASLAPTTPLLFRIGVVMAESFGMRVKVSVTAGEAQDPGLPEVFDAGSSHSAVYYATNPGHPGNQTDAELLIEGFDPVPFAVAHTKQGSTFVGCAGRWRYTSLSTERWNFRSTAEKPKVGRAADLELSGATLQVQLRDATPAEVKRCLQLQALRDAYAEEDYDTLHAQMLKAKTAGVDLEHLEWAEEKLKSLRKQGRHVHEGCTKDELRSTMCWSKVTTRQDEPNSEKPCSACIDCPCNVRENPGEVLEIAPGAVEAVLGPGSDKELFCALVEAALAAEEGVVWPAGGKLIFSAFDRNQSVTALTRMLEGTGQHRCAKMILDLVKAAEQQYLGLVTAVQVNFHTNGSSYHDQHRDIYSAKQRAGPNCNCSFRECVGTVCYSLGSSRICSLETMLDEASGVKACGEKCGGRSERCWLHSGSSMYFNTVWNQNHTHGIPVMPVGAEDAGPRISVAFLLGAPDTGFIRI